MYDTETGLGRYKDYQVNPTLLFSSTYKSMLYDFLAAIFGCFLDLIQHQPYIQD